MLSSSLHECKTLVPRVKLRPPLSQPDRPPQGRTVALSAARPGERPAVLTCPTSPGPVCSLSKIFPELSISTGRSQVCSGEWGVGAVRGGGVQGGEGERSSSNLASCRQAGALRAETLSLLPVLPGERGYARGRASSVCPHMLPPVAETQGLYQARPLLHYQREDPGPHSAGKIVCFHSRSGDPSTLPQNPRRQQSNKSSCVLLLSPFYRLGN